MNVNRAGAGVTLAVAFLLAGCSDATPGTTPTSSSTASQTSTPSTSVSATGTQSDSPEVQAEAAVVAFWAMRDQLASDPKQGVTKLSDVARDQALDVHRRSLNAQAAQGWKQVGLTSVTPQSATATDKPGEYVVKACINVSKVNIVDSEGKSQVPPGRPAQSSYAYKVQRDGEKWFVVQDLLEAKPC